MKLDKKLYGWAIGSAWSFASAAEAYCNEISITSLRNYFTSNSIPVDPSVMVMLGVGLIVLSVLIGKRPKNRAKDSAHP